MTTKWPWSQTPNDHKERFKRAKYGSLKISLKKFFQKPQKSWEKPSILSSIKIRSRPMMRDLILGHKKKVIKCTWNLNQKGFENRFCNCIWKIKNQKSKGLKETSKGIFYRKSLWQINKYLWLSKFIPKSIKKAFKNPWSVTKKLKSPKEKKRYQGFSIHISLILWFDQWASKRVKFSKIE